MAPTLRTLKMTLDNHTEMGSLECAKPENWSGVQQENLL